MIPVVTPDEMNAVDAASHCPVEELIDRAGRAVAQTALKMMGGTYGRRVIVVAGPGNNGADGVVAARHLRRKGVRCEVVDTIAAPARLPEVSLVIDAAFGTGLARPFDFPAVAVGTSVLAVDIPSGIDGLTGESLGEPTQADATITFAALKPGLLFEPGRSLAGRVEVADIGLDVGEVSTHAIGSADVAKWLPDRRADSHKWSDAVRIVAGSSGMTGAGHLAARAAQRSGAGYVQLGSPGIEHDPGAPTEAVGLSLPAVGWGEAALEGLERYRAVLVGPGLGAGRHEDLAVLASAPVSLVIDGDALMPEVLEELSRREVPAVITPHDGEWQRLGGSGSPDRIEATRAFAARHRVVVLRKGPTTVVAEPSGSVIVVADGSARLATAGTGDVLSGIVVAFLARGLDPFRAAAAAAQVHADAARLAPEWMIAGDLIDRIPDVLTEIGAAS